MPLLYNRNSSPLYKSKQQSMQLVNALINVNRRDLVEEVAGPQPKPVVPVPPRVTRGEIDNYNVSFESR